MKCFSNYVIKQTHDRVTVIKELRTQPDLRIDQCAKNLSAPVWPWSNAAAQLVTDGMQWTTSVLEGSVNCVRHLEVVSLDFEEVMQSWNEFLLYLHNSNLTLAAVTEIGWNFCDFENRVKSLICKVIMRWIFGKANRFRNSFDLSLCLRWM